MGAQWQAQRPPKLPSFGSYLSHWGTWHWTLIKEYKEYEGKHYYSQWKKIKERHATLENITVRKNLVWIPKTKRKECKIMLWTWGKKREICSLQTSCKTIKCIPYRKHSSYAIYVYDIEPKTAADPESRVKQSYRKCSNYLRDQ